MWRGTMPSEVSRPASLPILLPILTRRISSALAASPLASVRAFLQSIMPAPVFSRRALTSAALIVVLTGVCSSRGRRCSLLGLGAVGAGGAGLGGAGLAGGLVRLHGLDGRLGALLLGRGLVRAEDGVGDGRLDRRGGVGRAVVGARRRLLLPAGARHGLLLVAAPQDARGLRGLLGGLGLGGGLAARGLLRLAAGGLLGLTGRDGLLLAGDAGLLGGAPLAGALGDRVAQRPGDQVAGADRVVVAGDDEVHAVGVAVGVDQADQRDAQALGLADADDLGLEVDDEDRVGRARHVLDAAQVGAQLGEVGLGGQALARRQQRELAVGLVALEVVQALDALVDRLEVGQQAAQPAMVDVRHAARLGDALDVVAGLLLGPDEQDGPAAGGEVVDELLGLAQQALGLQEVDDVDPAALAPDEAAHLRVPTARLVTEVDSGLQQLPDADVSGHGGAPLYE